MALSFLMVSKAVGLGLFCLRTENTFSIGSWFANPHLKDLMPSLKNSSAKSSIVFASFNYSQVQRHYNYNFKYNIQRKISDRDFFFFPTVRKWFYIIIWHFGENMCTFYVERKKLKGLWLSKNYPYHLGKYTGRCQRFRKSWALSEPFVLEKLLVKSAT